MLEAESSSSSFPVPPRVTELSVRRVKTGQEQDFEVAREEFQDFLGGLSGVESITEFK